MPLPERRYNKKSPHTNNYLAIINGMIDTAWVIDKSGELLDVNDSAVSLLGYSRDELIKNGLTGIDASLTEVEINELVSTMHKDKMQVFKTAHKAKDGKVIPVEICSSLIPYNGKEVILSIARDITERKWAEEEIKKQLAEKETLIHAVHHRIKNNIASLESILSLQSRTVKNEEALAILNEAISRVSCIRILYELLLTTEDYSNSPVKMFLCKISESVMELYPWTKALRNECEIDDLYLHEKYLFPLGVILEELLTNIFKYAFPDKQQGNIGVYLKKDGNVITLTIIDNGVGLPEGFNIKSSNGFGLQIVQMLARQINGHFSIENREKQGIRCMISFPL